MAGLGRESTCCRLPFRDWTLVGWRSLRFSMSRGRVHSARPVLVPPVGPPPAALRGVEWSGASWHRPCGAGNTTPAVLCCLGGGSSCAAASRRLARAAASRPVPRRRNVEPRRAEARCPRIHGTGHGRQTAVSGCLQNMPSASAAVRVRCAAGWADVPARPSGLALSIRWPTRCPGPRLRRVVLDRHDPTARHGGESCRLVNRSPAVPTRLDRIGREVALASPNLAAYLLVLDLC